jgi:hypothetical protein
VFHESLGSVLREEDTKFGEDTDVSAVESHTGFKEGDHFVLVAEFFVVLGEFF